MARNNLIYKSTSNAFSTTLNGAIGSTTTTITLNSVSGLQNKAGMLVIDRQDSSGNNTPSKREYVYFTSVSGSSIVLPSVADGRGQDGSTGQSHSDGALVEEVLGVGEWNGLLTSYVVGHNDDGSLASSLTLTTPTITGAKQTLVADSDGATITFDLNAGSVHTVTLGGARTLALSNSAAGKVFVIRLTQDGSGSRTVTWFTTIKWAGGSAPTLTTTTAKTDVFGFICTSVGNYDGFVIGQNL
jgi:hypothetical protein